MVAAGYLRTLGCLGAGGSSDMTTRIEGQKFESIYDQKEISTYTDMEISKCKILGGGFGWR
jgi:hypothetical protein